MWSEKGTIPGIMYDTTELRIDKGIHAVQCIHGYALTIMNIIMLYYTYLERSYFFLFSDVCFILIDWKL